MTLHDHSVAPTQRQLNEAHVYDERAAALAEKLSDDDLRLDPATPPFPNREHIDFLTFALERLGSLAGRRVLETGCGTGTLTTWFAMQGARSVGIDVSNGNLGVAERRARVNGVASSATFLNAPVERLDHADGSYDAIIGNQVLHHFELPEAMANISRLLAPGGTAVFCEPVLFVPEIFRWLRNSRAVTRFFPSVADTPDERSLSMREVEIIKSAFGSFEMHPFQLTTRVQNFRPLSDDAFARLERVDRIILKLPVSRRLSRYVVFVVSGAPGTINLEEGSK